MKIKIMKKILNNRVVLLMLLFAFFAQNIQAQTAQDTIAEEETSFLVGAFEKYTENLNYFTVTALMTVESSFIPFPSEIVVPPAAYKACDENNIALHKTENRWVNIALVVLFATLGALLGAIINYCLAYFLGRPFIYWFVETRFGRMCMLSKEKVIKAEDYFVKHGNISTFIGRLIPGIRQLISIPAGLAKMNLSSFIAYTFLGAAIWNVVLAVVGYVAHGNKELIAEYAHVLSYVLLGLAVCGGVIWAYKAFKPAKNSDEKLSKNE